jgi:hypothetical protein
MNMDEKLPTVAATAVRDIDAEWCALANAAPPPIVIAPVRFIHQRNDDSILFSTATLRALGPERPQTAAVTAAEAPAAASTIGPRALAAAAVAPASITFVPVKIPAPKNVIEKWLWRLTAASVAMLVFFLAAVVELVLIVPPSRPFVIAAPPSSRGPASARAPLAPYLRRR